MTPVQLIQNLSAMASGPDGSRPSDTLRRLIQIHIGANSVAQQNHSGLARGDDLRLDLELTFQEAIFGCEKEVQIMHLERDGAGGTVQVARALKIEVPAGVDSGTRLRVAGEGDAGANNGESGDLYLYLLAPTEADGWKREDINILSDLKITKAQGQNGDQVTVNTIHGEAILTIPPGTTSGDQLTLKGKGVPKLGYPNQKGDHIVRILL
ncbi:DnaJ C-terminal domain-containing protein [Leptolyngbya sp. 'hensonii']|uniref:DnaJ C-terminal domain-containing protein n=1 Tax=Leptolyngbya sp. 'hensonii' TaxID=1922337 RepID=UPI0015C538E7|nr:DnaJ C-terminal domain-containing protein [Leptolyngbya sp. 'hensonii']